MNLEHLLFARNANLQVIKFLGKGKSGYSYLIKEKEVDRVLKIIHNEPFRKNGILRTGVYTTGQILKA